MKENNSVNKRKLNDFFMFWKNVFAKISKKNDNFGVWLK
jgi:hypothetical protein